MRRTSGGARRGAWSWRPCSRGRS
uniref:Uncharacterized protein n=1 Tax=Arundo donax TaxID=35708 RepID=A0A0A8Z1A4_ARUDO